MNWKWLNISYVASSCENTARNDSRQRICKIIHDVRLINITVRYDKKARNLLLTAMCETENLNQNSSKPKQ